ncbi:hypothetical protein [Gordonia insulae]|uniref:Uncharacterized protein n=1 Tax=Gordonia insulae TaxID=2420509 RepID=A0A3G8JSX6_9ACTN|nr:hypothetical protein [Gordonia insulae]AZG48038.1 hypothetical protein D7316_04651 [Gordonia insulae]
MTAPVIDEGQREDVRDLLGMGRPGAWLVLGAFLTAIWILVSFAAQEASAAWPLVIAGLILSAAAVAIVQVPGDPLPLPATVILTAAGPAACAFALSVTPSWAASSVLVMWTHGSAVAVFAFMCVRGRRLAPWVGLAGEAVVFAYWGHAVGVSPLRSAALIAIDMAPLAMATLFSFTLRPTAKAVFALRAQTLSQVARLSAEAAATEERTNQVRFLDHLARPMLERIASGDVLTDAERTECALLEAHLRDRLRAPLMSALELDELAYRARTLGVEVVFIDDSRSDLTDTTDGVAIDPRVATVVRELATDVLGAADDGRVFVRVSAPDRPIAASVLHRHDDGSTVRTEIDPTGEVRSFS